MKLRPTASIVEHFASIPDPRLDRRKRHKLSDIFFITLCTVICGANDWASIEQFGRAKEKWFTNVLDLKHGIPSHDTFGRVFGLIDSHHSQNQQSGEGREAQARWADTGEGV